MSLRWRIAVALAVLAAAVGAVAATGSYLATARQLRSGIDGTLESRASAANAQDGGGHHGPGPDGRREEGCPDPGAFQPASAARIVSEDGTVRTCIVGGPELPEPNAADLVVSGRPSLRTIQVDGVEYRLLTTSWRNGGVLQIARSLEESTHVLHRLRLQLLAVVAGGALLAAALGWWIARRMVTPIVVLRDAAETIAATGDLTTPIVARSSGEVGSLATSFRTMVAALARSQDQQKRLVSDAGHEMRTPLTSLRSNVETLEHVERLDPDDRRAAIADVLGDVDELTALLTELVELASDASAVEPLEEVALGDLAREVAVRVERRTGRPVSVVEARPVRLEGRPRQLDRAISNLLDNAVKYGGGGPVEVTVDGPSVEVRDHGSGFRAEDEPHVFERFYRSVGHRSEPGSGLGLAIVEQVVQGHGGRVWARNHPDGGGVVGFRLPDPQGDVDAR